MSHTYSQLPLPLVDVPAPDPAIEQICYSAFNDFGDLTPAMRECRRHFVKVYQSKWGRYPLPTLAAPLDLRGEP